MEITKFTISRNDAFMEGWPDLIKLKSGRLIVAYNECTSHTDRHNTHITIRTSDDNGTSWSDKIYVGEETHHGNQYNSIRINQMSDEKIILVCDRINGSETSDGCLLHMFESLDDGTTWSDATITNIEGYCSDKVREMSDGSYLICISKYNKKTGKSEIIAHKSYDNGRTWTKGVLAATSDKYTFIEPAVLTLNDGVLCVFLRENSQKGYNGFVVYSSDNGETFGDISEIPIPGMHRPFVGYLSDGRIMLSYREFLKPLNTENFKGTSANLKMLIFSEDMLKKANFFETHLIDHDNAEFPDQGYSAWVQLDNNSIIMANYIVDDAPNAYIRGYMINLEGK